MISATMVWSKRPTITHQTLNCVELVCVTPQLDHWSDKLFNCFKSYFWSWWCYDMVRFRTVLIGKRSQHFIVEDIIACGCVLVFSETEIVTKCCLIYPVDLHRLKCRHSIRLFVSPDFQSWCNLEQRPVKLNLTDACLLACDHVVHMTCTLSSNKLRPLKKHTEHF